MLEKEKFPQDYFPEVRAELAVVFLTHTFRFSQGPSQKGDLGSVAFTFPC